MTICYSGNHLLHALLAAQTTLMAHVRPVELSAGTVLQQAFEPVRQVYFPVDALLSVQQSLADGHLTEIAAIGSEGLSGVVACLLGADRPSTQLLVTLRGWAYQLDLEVLRASARQSERVRALLLRYMARQLGELSQLHGCATHHSALQRLCAWLLQIRARFECDAVAVTHDDLGNILGLRRESVSHALARLRGQGTLTTRRFSLRMVDVAALQQQACACHVPLQAALQQWRRELQDCAAPLPQRRSRAADRRQNLAAAGGRRASPVMPAGPH
ncbi:MAG: Crp/Fnr family transcriptional regulator [Sphingomonadaceae bacterium]